MSTLLEPFHDDELNDQADNIASKIAEIMIKAFKEKEGRDPTTEEIECLFDEVTEERISAMLGENSLSNNDSTAEDFHGSVVEEGDNNISNCNEKDAVVEDEIDINNNRSLVGTKRQISALQETTECAESITIQ